MYERPLARTPNSLSNASRSRALPGLASVALNPSRYFRFGIAAVVALAVLLLCLSLIPLMAYHSGYGLLLLLAVCAVLGNGWWGLRQHRRLPGRISVWSGVWHLEGATRADNGHGGDWHFAGEVLLWPWLVIVPLKREDGRRITLIWWPDSAPAEDQRRLRVWLNTVARRARDT